MTNMSGSSDFALRLTQQCCQTGKNVCLSPYSARIALSIALNGARGETLRQMSKVLGYGSNTIEQINKSNVNIHRMISKGQSYKQLMVANSLWLNSACRLKPAFVNSVSSTYGALVKSLDFDNPHSMNTINRWISEVTNGRIERMSNVIDAQMVCVIINTAFFEKEWMMPFEPKDNTRGTWYGSGNRRSQITYMNQTKDLLYRKTKEYEVVNLPYLLSGFSMSLLLPSAGSNPLNVLSKLNSKTFDVTSRTARPVEVYLTLPKFKFDSEIDLIPPLIRMGMKTPFGEHPDFSAICANTIDRTFIGRMKQRCSIEVNEKGTVAAAETEGIPYGAFPVILKFNRPFVFMIRHDGTGDILFSGVVYEPQ